MRKIKIGKGKIYFEQSMKDLYIMGEEPCVICNKPTYNECYTTGGDILRVCCLDHAKESLLTKLECFFDKIRRNKKCKKDI